MSPSNEVLAVAHEAESCGPLALSRAVLGALASTLFLAPPALGAPEQTTFKFDFGSGKVAPGYIQILPGTVYTKELGYGFDLGSKVAAVDRGGDDPLRGDFCTSDHPFFFSVAL